MIVPLAHAGHVLIELPIYLGPALLLVLWFKLGDWLKKRRERKARRR